MANIQISDLVRTACLFTGATDANTDFVDAVRMVINRVSRDIERITGGAFAPAMIDSMSGEMDVPVSYFSVYETGLAAYLQDYGEWGRKANPEAKSTYASELRSAQPRYARSINVVGPLGNYSNHWSMNTSENLS